MGIDFETVRRIALGLPDVTESLGARGWAFKAQGKFLACQAVHRSAEVDTLVVQIALEDRAELLKAHPTELYLTAHYVAYPSVLVRLRKIDEATLEALFGRAWTFVTAKPARTKPERRSKPQAGKSGTSSTRRRKRGA